MTHNKSVSGGPAPVIFIRVRGQACLPGLRVLLIHPLLGLLEQAHGLLGLVAQVFHEDAEILILAQDLHLAFVPGQDGAKVLVGVGQQVQDVRGTVLQRHLGILTQTHDLDAKHKGGQFQTGQTDSILSAGFILDLMCQETLVPLFYT